MIAKRLKLSNDRATQSARLDRDDDVLIATGFDTSLDVPKIGRIVVHGGPNRPQRSEQTLFRVLTAWPAGLHLKFLITPGGFASFPFRQELKVSLGWKSSPADLGVIQPDLELKTILTERVLQAASGKVDVITMGVDLGSSSRSAELVAIHEVETARTRWTGKSYPTAGQERTLMQVSDLESHLINVADERVLVLGCNDLNMFSPRGWENQNKRGIRRTRCREMRRLASRFQPTIVLHHPHRTDSPNIWSSSWGVLRKQRTVEAWASAIGYHRGDQPPRAPLSNVLAATSGGLPSVAFVVKGDKRR